MNASVSKNNKSRSLGNSSKIKKLQFNKQISENSLWFREFKRGETYRYDE